MKQILSNEHFIAYAILRDNGIEDNKAYVLATAIIQEIIPPEKLKDTVFGQMLANQEKTG